MLYSISNLIKIYENRTVLKIDALGIEQNRIYGLLGPNGAGKTTLINILGFLESPTTGEIYYRSKKVVYSESLLQDLRKTVVVVDQTPILFSTSVYKNLEFGLKVRKKPGKERDFIIQEALDLVGMRTFMHAPAHRLSGGETQRVALARALALSPQVLMCDEPTASVDVENQAAIIKILDDINREKKITILFTTHDRSQAAALAHQILFLNNGMLTNGSRENLFRANVRKLEDKKIQLRINGGLQFILPDNKKLPEGRIRIVIDPEKLSLSKLGEDPPMENSATGKIIQVGEEKEKIRLVVDLGIQIILFTSKQAYRSQRPMVGDRVEVIFPPDSFRGL
ncbi:MAG TPA: ATP-binding cassette domain-containing protein [Deltaproteobacteria bacterium]|nr:ATP-binding cassette domain-containing protein [Deltaproteobacteria bacterium]